MVPKLIAKSNIIISVCILFLGVISMLYGFVNGSSLMIAVGVPLTLITSIMIVFESIKPSKRF